jgi:hypothetical protein
MDSNFVTVCNNYQQHIQQLAASNTQLVQQQKALTEQVFGFMTTQTQKIASALQLLQQPQHHRTQQSNTASLRQQREDSTEEEEDDDDDDEVVYAGGAAGDDGSFGTPQQQPEQRQQQRNTNRNALQLLLPRPRKPPLNATFPKTWPEFLTSWESSLGLSYEHARKTDWEANFRLRYSRHLGAWQQLQRRLAAWNNALQPHDRRYDSAGIAIILETERVGRKVSLRQHVDQLKRDGIFFGRERQQQQLQANNNNNNNNTATTNTNNNRTRRYSRANQEYRRRVNAA